MTVSLRLHTGTLRTEWCDECLVSHVFADIYTLTESGPVVVGRFADHNEDEDEDEDR